MPPEVWEYTVSTHARVIWRKEKEQDLCNRPVLLSLSLCERRRQFRSHEQCLTDHRLPLRQFNFLNWTQDEADESTLTHTISPVLRLLFLLVLQILFATLHSSPLVYSFLFLLSSSATRLHPVAHFDSWLSHICLCVRAIKISSNHTLISHASRWAFVSWCLRGRPGNANHTGAEREKENTEQRVEEWVDDKLPLSHLKVHSETKQNATVNSEHCLQEKL